MSFTSCSHVSIKGKNTFNHTEGPQVNGTINAHTVNFNPGQAVAKCTKYNQFREVILGDVFLKKELHTSDWHWKWGHGKVFAQRKAQRTIYTAEIMDRKPKFTVITYEGKDAQSVWEEDFEQFSHTKKLHSFQLFGINQSIPMLIFHDELIPLGHFYKHSFWSHLYLEYLMVSNRWGIYNVWMDGRGSLCDGPEGPHEDSTLWVWHNTSLVMPLKVGMLKDKTSFQFFCKIGSSMDDSVLQTAEGLQFKNPDDAVWNSAMYLYLRDLWQDLPYHFLMNVISGFQFDTVYSPSMEAVARWPQGAGPLWEWCELWRQLGQPQSGCLVEKTVLDGGLTRFTLDLTQEPYMYLSTSYNFKRAWLSQSSWVFNALNSTEGEENFFVIQPPWISIRSTLHGYDGLAEFFNLCDGKPSAEEIQPTPSPIYLFLHPLPESISELATWRH
uniref:Uncharacterized protein n=1 Tax=Moniliophthora roreri TaxID=221103 RepID=A0A0W0FU60_MONRR